MEVDYGVIQQICNDHQITIHQLNTVTGSFDKKIFFINQQFLLRVSETSMAQEQQKFWRLATLEFTPRILHTGIIYAGTGQIHYTLLTLLPGDDFVNLYPQTTLAQQEQLGGAAATFLDHLHEISGSHYDIGLYIPILPDYSDTWQAGHQAYWEILQREAQQLPLKPASSAVFEHAFKYLNSVQSALAFQSGPRLLHNDFHPKNILLDRGLFSGVIDWECSQYGEADFELTHLVHWCVYPPNPDINFRPFLRSLFKAAPNCAQVPRLAQRLTIYQVEHEMQQIIWSGCGAEYGRIPRLTRWLSGAVDELLCTIGC